MQIRDSFERFDDGLLLTRWTLDSQAPPTFQAGGEFAGRVDRWQQFRFIAPSIILMYSGAVATGTGGFENGMRDGEFAVRMLHAMTPESEHRTHYFWTIANNSRRKDEEMNQRLFKDTWNAFKQDEFVLEQQYRRLRTYPERTYVDINTDRARLHARRVVARAAGEAA
jgi:vanillate O-demethylase monooxygenase subunit